MFDQVLITGGGGGFGREIINQIEAKRILILTRQNESTLKDQISNIKTGGCEIVTITIDYLSPNAKDIISEKLTSFIDKTLSLIYFCNAGTLSTLAPSAHFQYENITTSMTVNCSMPFYITSKLLGFMLGELMIVNVSSLAAIQPTPNMRQKRTNDSLYCSAKACREMFFNTVLLEYPSTRLLHYAPGPMNTDMQVKIRNEMPDGQVKQEFIKMYEDDRLVDIADSVQVLLNLVKNDEFVSGSHIDYYDIRISDKDNRVK